MHKLKKHLPVFAAFLIIRSAMLYGAADWDLPDVADEYIGTYIPVDIEEEIIRTKDFYGALEKYGYPNHHDVLFLGKNKCYSDAHFHDSYAIRRNVFSEYRFETTDEGKFIYDEKGFKYRQITDFLDEYGRGYKEFDDYVSKLIFDGMYSLKNVKVTPGHIELDGVNYSINDDPTFFDTTNVQYWLWSETTSHCALVRNGLNGELHEGVRDEYRIWSPKEEVKAIYPLMFLSSADPLPWFDDLPESQYRLLRNLVYARHGYIFKSADLKAVFSQFTWYEPDPHFSESMLSAEEKAYVKKIQQKEADLKAN
ncbi:MAG: YARHG domain-containing protein [Treponemataceae bacterium]|nr:YARHG domain-containing protein [Treponemataceae bacterium]